MKILLVAATTAEIAPFTEFLSLHAVKEGNESYTYGSVSLVICTTGVGMLATAFKLTRVLAHQQYDLVINAGIAGVFDKEAALGTVFNITSEYLPEIGAEDGEDFISIFDLHLLGKNDFPFIAGAIRNQTQTGFKTIEHLPETSGITVNKVHGNTGNIAQLLKQMPFTPGTESMEGAAVAYVCTQQEQPYVQIRAVSNYVERRNREAWKIGLAVKNLNDTLIALIKESEK